jgi:hypothetical protein
MHLRQMDALEADGGGRSRQNLSEVDGLIGMCWRQAEQLECQKCCKWMKYWRRRDALEVAECIGGAQRWTELMELMEQMELEGNTKCQRQLKWSELITDGWNLFGVASFLLHVGFSDDRFGG